MQLNRFCLDAVADRSEAQCPDTAESAAGRRENHGHWHCPREPRITIKGQHGRQAIGLQEGDNS